MPTPQNTTNLPDTTNSSLGPVAGYSVSDQAMLTEMFPGPLTSGDSPYSPEAVKKLFLKKVMRGTCVDSESDSPDSAGANGYWAFDSGIEFSRDYVGSDKANLPDYTFEWKTNGDPLNSFIPATAASPNLSILQQPAPGMLTVEYANQEGRRGSAPFEGPGTVLTPVKARDNLLNGPLAGWSPEGDQLGIYIMGDSGASTVPAPPPPPMDSLSPTLAISPTP